MKIPNFPYHFARAEAAAARALYRSLLPAIVRSPLRARGSIPLEVFAYSGESALPEQVASIRSFLRYAGRPKRFTVVSDGTYSSRSVELLKRIDPVVSIGNTGDWMPKVLPDELQLYLGTHATGKQLALIMSLPANGPALYVDSDVLFFPGARDLIAHLAVSNVPAFYLADCDLAADRRLFRDPAETNHPVNTGVLVLLQKLDWSLSLGRFGELEGAPIFFTNQTMAHLTMHANGAKPLDESKYVLQRDDQFIYRDHHRGSDLALRHYVNPVRHRFWTRIARRGAW